MNLFSILFRPIVRAGCWGPALVFILVSVPNLLKGQIFPNRDTVPVEEVRILHADIMKGERKGGAVKQRLSGNVQLRQGSTFMRCREATLFENDVQAVGDIVIQQGDSSSLFADSLSWLGDTKVVHLFDSVVLVNGASQLFSDYLYYDLEYEIASYTSGALLKKGTAQLRSRRGHYFVNRKMAYFKEQVEVVDSGFSLKSDSLLYYVEEDKAVFPGPSIILRDGARIFSESGWYSIPLREGVFEGNVQYLKGNQRASGERMEVSGSKAAFVIEGNAAVLDSSRTARAHRIRYQERQDIHYLEGTARFVENQTVAEGDTIIYFGEEQRFLISRNGRLIDSVREVRGESIQYDEKSGEGWAIGRVLLKDSVEKTTLLCDSLFYYGKRGTQLAYGGRPLLLMETDGDTLYMSADTFYSFLSPADTFGIDSFRILTAFPETRLYKQDMQGICDSLTYHSKDSAFVLYKRPFLWTDTTQFHGNTIRVQLASNQISRVEIEQNAMVVTSPDAIYFNQVKGKRIEAGFIDNALHRTDVYGNAEALYYLVDEDNAYIGMNRTVASKLSLLFEDNQVTDIYFYEKPSGAIDPMSLIPRSGVQLEGFHWEVKKRPLGVEDLFSRHYLRLLPGGQPIGNSAPGISE